MADALSRIALSLDYQVVRVVEERERRDIDAAGAQGALVETLESLETVLRAGASENTAAVVASQGHYDEQALEIILRCGASYVGLVASRKRGASVRDYLDARGVPGLDDVRMPAGLDLGARTPPEVALSILAEIVKTRPSSSLNVRGAGLQPCIYERRRPTPHDRHRSRLPHGGGGRDRAAHGGRGRHALSTSAAPSARRGSRRSRRAISNPSPEQTPGELDARRPRPVMIDAATIRERFRARGFIVADPFATALQLVLALEKPLLVEGPAGVGKTESAKVLAEVLGTRLIRLQCYEGLDALTALYEWNYPRQMLRIRMSEADGASIEQREAQIFGETFLLKRPLLEAITQDRSPVLLIDEVDRADEAFEAFLLEVLAEWQVTIPEIGTIRARHRPHVVLTSNRTRELSDALRRRCLFFWLPYPTLEEEVAILHARIPDLSARLAEQIARAMQVLRGDAAAEGAGCRREPGLGHGPSEPAPRSSRRRHDGADAGLRAESARRPCRAARRARAPRADSGGPIERARARRPRPRDGLRIRIDLAAEGANVRSGHARAVRSRTPDLPMYPFASLPENLTAFCGVLRRDHGFRIGPRELQDAARALQVAPIADERAVRDALRPVLSRTVDDSLKFDAAFRAFFYPGPGARCPRRPVHS